MSVEKKDLSGVLCPYCIVNVITSVEKMKPGNTNVFIVDDPLAIKAIPEELEEQDGIAIEIERCKRNWEVKIEKKQPIRY